MTIPWADFEFVVSDKGGIEDILNLAVDLEARKIAIRAHRLRPGREA